MELFKELKRRNVIRVAILYVVASWLLLQVADLLFDAMDLPSQWLRLVLALLILGFPLVLAFSWVFELTPEGVKREKDVDRSQSITAHTGQRINTLIVVLLVLAIGAVAVDRLVPESGAPPEQAAAIEPAPEPEAGAGASAESVAVLPFADLSPGGDHEYFSDGIAEEILNVLVRVEGLKVASRTTAWGFKGQESLGIPLIAERLKVRHVLEGSVRRSGDTVRITAQLIDAQTDQHLWSQTYDRTLTTESIFAIQDDIAGAIAAQLGAIIDPGAAAAERAADTRNVDAYELFLEAQQRFVQREGLARSMALFEQALEIDPEFARAWAGLAAVYHVAPSWNIRDRDYYALAKNAAQKAIELNPNLALAYAVLGGASGYERPIAAEAALAYYDKALELSPKETTTLLWRAILWLRLGFFDRAVPDLERCLQIDPAYENCRRHLALAYLFNGDIDEGLALYEEGLANGYTGSETPFYPVYVARGDLTVVTASLSHWYSARGMNSLGRLSVRAVTDPAYDFESERAEIELVFKKAMGRELDWKKEHAFWSFTFRNYAAIDDAHSPWWWCPYPEEYRRSPERERLMRDLGLPLYWRKHGFPPQCRPIGDDGFECD